MDRENVANEWGVKICPVRNKQCLEAQCAWWLEEESMCAVKKIKIKD